jgi:hypothetical protein
MVCGKLKGMSGNLLRWAIASIPVIILCGMLLHFAYPRSHGSRLAAVLAPVNESLWEHLKMAYWPLLTFTAVEVVVLDETALLGAAALGFYTTSALILGLYYPTALFLSDPEGTGRLVADAIIFVVAIGGGQLIGHALVGRIQTGVVPGLVMLLAPALVLAAATFAPPRTSLFRDQITGSFGVPHRNQRSS